jgi:hypothetical protein
MGLPSTAWLLTHVGILAFAWGSARIALVWFAIERFGNAGLSLVILTISVGQFVGAFVAGQLTDRMDKRSVAVHSSWLSGLGLAVFALCMHVGVATVYAVLPILFLSYVAMAIHDNAARTLIPQIAQGANLEAVNGRFVTLGEVVYFAAPLAAGWAVELFGGKAVLIASCALAALAASVAARVRLMAGLSAASPPSAKSIRGLSVKFVVDSKWLLGGLTAATLANLLLVPINTVLVPLRITDAGLGPVQLGYFSAAISAGMAVGGLIKPPRLGSVSTNTRLAVFLGLSLPFYLLIGSFSGTAGVVACGIAAGAALCLFEVAWNAVMQERSPTHLLGRIYALGSWLSFAARAVGVAVSGAVVAHFGASTAIALNAAGMAVGLILLALVGKVALDTK